MVRKRTGRVQFLVLLRLWTGPPLNNNNNNNKSNRVFLGRKVEMVDESSVADWGMFSLFSDCCFFLEFFRVVLFPIHVVFRFFWSSVLVVCLPYVRFDAIGCSPWLQESKRETRAGDGRTQEPKKREPFHDLEKGRKNGPPNCKRRQ